MANAVEALRDIFSDDYQSLIAQLEASGIKLGDKVGEGAFAQVYKVKDRNDKEIPSVVIRIEPEGSGGNLLSPVIVPVLSKHKSENFEATIVPAAKRRDDYTAQEVKKTLAVLNAQGLLGNISDLNNPIPDQFMELSDIDIPVFIDLNGVSNAPDVKARMGGIEQFAEKHGVDASEIRSSKDYAGAERLKPIMKALIEKCTKELKDSGIKISASEAMRASA